MTNKALSHCSSGLDDCIFSVALTPLNNIDYYKIQQDIIDSFVNEDAVDRSCELCGESFTYLTELVAHLQLVHGIERPYKCPHCDKAYAQRFMLNGHVRKRHGARLVVACAHCSFSTLDRAKLERHIERIHHADRCLDNGRLYLDDVGYATTPSTPSSGSPSPPLAASKPRRGRPRTGRSLRPDRTYLCAHCGKELKTVKGLQIHTRLHTGEKPYECRVCGKRFTCETLLSVHRVTHTGERPYGCDLCHKAFTQRSSLAVHKRSAHTGERPHVCEICGKGWVTKFLLKAHRKSCLKKTMAEQ